jgi:hypothetical protein
MKLSESLEFICQTLVNCKFSTIVIMCELQMVHATSTCAWCCSLPTIPTDTLILLTQFQGFIFSVNDGNPESIESLSTLQIIRSFGTLRALHVLHGLIASSIPFANTRLCSICNPVSNSQTLFQSIALACLRLPIYHKHVFPAEERYCSPQVGYMMMTLNKLSLWTIRHPMSFFDWRKVKTHSERVVKATPPPTPKQLCPLKGEDPARCSTSSKHADLKDHIGPSLWLYSMFFFSSHHDARRPLPLITPDMVGTAGCCWSQQLSALYIHSQYGALTVHQLFAKETTRLIWL